MNIEGFYTDSGIDGAVDEFVIPARTEFIKNTGFNAFSVYPNYARGDEGPIAWYSAQNLPRLTALKQKWDPKQLFSVNYPVPLHFP